MSRKETIIVAVLINAGLLIVLFASALKSSQGTQPATAPSLAVQERKEVLPVADGRLDAISSPLSAIAAAQSESQMVAQVPSVSLDFVDDLKMVGQPGPSFDPSSQAPAVRTLVAPVAPPEKTAPEFTEIKVKKGDVLEKIARYHHTTVAEIMKVNKLANTQLRIGQVLKIPNKAMVKAATSTIAHSEAGASSPTSDGTKYYTVKKGDSPWTIAIKNHMQVTDLLKLNQLSEEQARRLKPGDQLRIQ
jgi:peptidoglycan DL-endopeptidase LytF